MRLRLLLSLVLIGSAGATASASLVGKPAVANPGVVVRIDADVTQPGIQDCALLDPWNHTVAVVMTAGPTLLSGYSLNVEVSDTGVLGNPVTLDTSNAPMQFILGTDEDVSDGFVGLGNWDPCGSYPSPLPAELVRITFTVRDGMGDVSLSIPTTGDRGLVLDYLPIDAVYGVTLRSPRSPGTLFEFSKAWNETDCSTGMDFVTDGTIDEKDLVRLLRGWCDPRYQRPPTPTQTFTPTVTRTPTTVPTVTQTLTPTPTWTAPPVPTPHPMETRLTVDLPGLPAWAMPLVMVGVPAGSFEMGSVESADWSPCYPCEQPVHTVEIGSDFFIGKYEITQAQWESVMGSNPATSSYGIGPNRPVYFVSWREAREFIDVLNSLGQGTFRLPTEAEWEYACRGGTTNLFFFGPGDSPPDRCSDVYLLADYAWYCGNAGNVAHPVGLKRQSRTRLFDIYGNVAEWCEDDWHGGYTDAPSDGSAWIDEPRSFHRVIRGGGLTDFPRACRSASRVFGGIAQGYGTVGFRVVLETDDPPPTPTPTLTRAPTQTRTPTQVPDPFGGS